MRVRVTLTQIKRQGAQTQTVSGDWFIEGADLELYAKDTVLAIRNPNTKTEYVTDFAFSGVNAVLAAAPTTGGHFLLT